MSGLDAKEIHGGNKTMPTKVYIICQNHPYHTIGGVQTVVKRLAEAAADHGFDTNLVTLHPQIKANMSADGIHVTCLKSLRLPWLSVDVYLPEIVEFAKLMRRIKDSIIHIHAFHSPMSFLAILFSHQSNKLIFHPHYHGRSSSRLANVFLKVYKASFRLVVGRVAVFICVSRYEKEIFVSQLKVPEKKVEVIPNGYDFSEILKYRWQGSQLAKGKKLLFVGRLVTHKNAHQLVEAVAKDNSLWLTIVGDGPLEKRIKKMVIGSGLEERVNLKKGLTKEELFEEYCQTDLFILPSLNEAFGIVAGEAALVGCPVIVAESQALAEFVENKVAHGIKLPITPEKILEAIYDSSLQTPRQKATKVLKDWGEVTERVTDIYYALSDEIAKNQKG